MSFQNSSMLVSLNITQWTARKLDRTASDELCDSKEAKHGSGNFNKVLIPKIHLKQIQRIVNSIRNYHYANTLPWDHKGSDILPSAMYFDYKKHMEDYKEQFMKAVDEFLKDYPTIIQQVQKSLGHLYNQADYPTVEQIRNKFNMFIDISPIPNVSDFRIDITDKEINKIKKDLKDRLEAANNAAEQELFARLYTVTAKAVVTLKDPDKIFRNSLILNILELSKKVPKLNINNNKELNNLAKDLIDLSNNTNIDALRDIEQYNYRLQTANQYEIILNNIEDTFNQSKSNESNSRRKNN